MNLDIDHVRSCFPQASDSFVYCSNAGGSFVAAPVLDLMEQYNRRMRIQPYAPFSPSREGGEAMDRARERWCAALNISDDELTIGPSTSANSYTMAHAIGAGLSPGDEIIVCQQDHEANHGPWRRMAEAQGLKLKQWDVDPDTGLLDPSSLDGLLGERTRWVFFTHCSNLVGTTNPVREIVDRIRAASPARVCVDGVAHTPHHIPDLRALDVDMYLFSLYKVYGPHQGILYVRRDLHESLAPQSHEFLAHLPNKRYNPAGPQHAQVAASAGVIDYFEGLMAHHGISEPTLTAGLDALHQVIAAHEAQLAAPIVDYLHQSPDVQLLGKGHVRDGDRAPTIAFRPRVKSSAEVASAMQAEAVGAEHGDFYAGRVLDGMGIDRRAGVVRLSLVHYNTVNEAQKIVAALDRALA